MQVVFPDGSSCVYLPPVTWCSLVFGTELFTDCSLSSDQAIPQPWFGPQILRRTEFCGWQLSCGSARAFSVLLLGIKPQERLELCGDRMPLIGV